MENSIKLVFSLIAIALTFIAFVPYIVSILTNTTKPHVFSWLIWGITTIIVFFAQYKADGGYGAWPIGVSGVVTIFIAVLAFFKRTDNTITRIDWGFFIAAFASLPFWYFSADPLWAVVVLTLVDLCGFGPTLRKAYHLPYEENLTFFGLFAVRNSFALIALEYYSLTTMLFPAAVALACLVLIVLVLIRRSAMGVTTKIQENEF